MKKKQAQALKSFAQKLVAISKSNGEIDATRVDAVLTHMRTRDPKFAKPLLKQYAKCLQRDFRQSHLVIEHATPLSADKEKQFSEKFSAHYQRPLSTSTQSNPGLLAGYRLSVADDVWDLSIANRLDRLEKEAIASA